MSDPVYKTVDAQDAQPFKASVVGCQRCGGFHADVVFLPFTHQPQRGGYSHFGECPMTLQPIMMSVQNLVEEGPAA